jgi:hypothetical protein
MQFTIDTNAASPELLRAIQQELLREYRQPRATAHDAEAWRATEEVGDIALDPWAGHEALEKIFAHNPSVPLGEEVGALLRPTGLFGEDPEELDSAGQVWDEAVHSGTRAKNVDGTWRFRRNLDKSLRTVAAPPPPARTVAAPPPPARTVVAPPPPLQTVDELLQNLGGPAPAPSQSITWEDFRSQMLSWGPPRGPLDPKAGMEIARRHGLAHFGQLAQPEFAHLLLEVYEDIQQYLSSVWGGE